MQTLTRQHHLQAAKHLASLLDNRFQLFGYKFGLDPIIGLIPGIGDTVSLLLSFSILYLGWQLGLSTYHLIRMLFNILIDAILGAVPLLGDIFDFANKANQRNLSIIYAQLPQHEQAFLKQEATSYSPGDHIG